MIYKFKSWVQLDRCDRTLFPFIQKPNIIEEYIHLMDNEDIEMLSANPAAVPYLTLKENQDKICWSTFVRNEGAMEYIKTYPHVVDFNLHEVIEILNNPHPDAISIIETEIHRMEDKWMVEIYYDVPMLWNWLSSNPAAVPLLEKYPDCIVWSQCSKNPAAIHLLEKNKDKIHWGNLSANPAAIDILLQHPHKINWSRFSSNTNPIAVKMLEKNPDKIDWGNLSRNSSAIHLLETNLDKVTWETILLNKNIYDYDYAKMKMNMDVLREEMMMMVWKPSRVIKWLEAGCEEIFE